jgi:hypothetical protein
MQQGLKPTNLLLVLAKRPVVEGRQPAVAATIGRVVGELQGVTGPDPVAEERAYLLQVIIYRASCDFAGTIC